MDQRVELRGFSAGSFAGLSTLQLLWKIPNVVTKGKLGAIACPPQLLVTPPATHALHLLHYESDRLCVWKPGQRQLDQLQIRYTYVRTEGPAYKEHFGAKEHSYSHWLSLDLPAGWWDLARLLFMHPDAASAAKRDATPLRLLSWLSFRLEPAVEELIEDTMLYLSTAEKVTKADLLSLGTKHLDKGCESVEALRDHLIELVSVRNLKHRPEALFALFRQFLQRLTLPRLCHLTFPRLCHFLDLVLPQLTPVRAPWADATRTLWTCHHIRAVSHENGYPYKPKVAIAYFYTAHDNIHHVRVLWSTLPLLLFSDPRMVYPVDVYQFQGQAVHRLNQQHIQLGLRKGMTVLVYYRVQSGAHVNEIFQAVLIAQSRLRIEESAQKIGCGNGLSHQKQSLPGYHPILHGPSAVMPYVGDVSANILLSMKHTWGCRDVRSKRTSSLKIWCSSVIHEVRKNLLSLPTWPLNGCA